MSWETVYRVQDSEGRGPFKPGFSHLWVCHRQDHDNMLPWYEQFGPVHRNAKPGWHIGAACLTLEQLRRWFTREEYEKLQGFAYRAVRLKVPNLLARSDIQVVFERGYPLTWNAEPVELYPEEQNT